MKKIATKWKCFGLLLTLAFVPVSYTHLTKKFNTSQLTILGLMSGILFLMAYTPLGYLNVGPLAVTFNVIPVAICAIVLGPTGGAVAGAVFGLTSYMQAMGIGGVSALGSALFQISPVPVSYTHLLWL